MFHAIQYLLGGLEREHLSQLRAFGGLQAYPSRTKDPDPVDYSTGSVGLGAVAPLFGAVVDRYARTRFRDVEAKYGTQLAELFRRPGGDELGRHIDLMPNERYQSLFAHRGPPVPPACASRW